MLQARRKGFPVLWLLVEERTRKKEIEREREKKRELARRRAGALLLTSPRPAHTGADAR